MSETSADSPALRGTLTKPGPSLVRMLLNETSKGLLVLWANRGTLVPELAVLAVFYLFIQFFIGGGRLVQALYAQTLLGFCFYALTYVVTLKMVAGTLDEMNSGTLEQSHLSPLPSWALALGRLAAATVEAVAVVVVVGTVLVVVLQIQFHYSASPLIPVVLTLIDVAGFGLLLGALAIRVSSIGAVLHVLQGIVLFLNGAFVPVSVYPPWLQAAARLLPTTLGVEVTRKILLLGGSLASTWSDGSLLSLFVHAMAMLGVGGVAYQLSIRRALRDGRLGRR